MSNTVQSIVKTFRQHADSRVITKVPVLEKRATQSRATADAYEPVVAGRCRLLDEVGTEIDSLAVLQVVHTYSTGFRSCPWSTSCSAMSQWRWGSEERLHRTAVVRGGSVPYERGLGTSQQCAQFAEELRQCLVVERSRSHGEHGSRVGPVEGEGARH